MLESLIGRSQGFYAGVDDYALIAMLLPRIVQSPIDATEIFEKAEVKMLELLKADHQADLTSLADVASAFQKMNIGGPIYNAVRRVLL